MGTRQKANVSQQHPGKTKRHLPSGLKVFSMTKDSLQKLKKKISVRLSGFAARIIIENTRDLKICIFSNDCWGAEFYRCTNRPYNTPFVGLMLMAPCYIKFLQNPVHYLRQDLKFTAKSKYQDLQELREKVRAYPVGLIEDIEVHFLHYTDRTEAYKKWSSRKRRIDWDNLYVKFGMDKDHADETLLGIFQELPYKNKISFSKYEYKSPQNVRVSNYVDNGAQMFTRCFREIDLLYWFHSGNIKRAQGIVALRHFFISQFLKIG